MDVINKFYSSMQTTVSHITSVLPGNNVTKEYEVLGEVASAGLGKYWKIYSGYKRSTKQEVSIFVFEKKHIEKWPKEEKEYLLNTLRRGIQLLTKMKHPRILTVQHPLEESRDSLAFASEPVITSLANTIEDKTSSRKLHLVEIVYGIKQLVDGIFFLHQDANLIHGNLCPESILLNKKRSWKIFGLDFSIKMNSAMDYMKPTTMHSPLAQPSLDYLAPERIKDETPIPENDLYSLGMLIYCVCTGKPLQQFENNYHSFKQSAMTPDLNNFMMSDEHLSLRDVVKCLLHPNPIYRPKLLEITKSAPFQEIGVKTLSYLDTIYQWNNLQKSKFYKGLIEIIPTFPHRVNVHTVVSYLVQEFVNLPMVPFVLPNILLIASMSTHQEYSEYIFPHLILIFGIEEPIQVLWIFMQKIDVLLKLTSSEDVKLHLLPLFHRSIDSEVKEIQEMGLQAIPLLLPLIDYNSIKNTILPRIKTLCLKNVDICIKVKCLLCIGSQLEYLDKWVLVSDVFPFLQLINNREPAVIMAMLGIHKIALTRPKLGIGADIMATKCIPFLSPLLMENSLSVTQFNSIATVIQDMFVRIEKEQRLKLERLSTANQNFSVTCFQMAASSDVPNQLKISPEQSNSLEKDSLKMFSNPLVVNRQLTAPTQEKGLGMENNNLNVIQPVNYVYSHHQKSNENNVGKFTELSRVDGKRSSPKSPNLISLTEQDILNFLK